MKALLLEDDKNRIKEFVQRFLDKQWSWDAVDTANQCIEKLKTVKYDIIFLDHDLGGETYVDLSNKNTGSEVARFWNKTENINKDSIVIVHSYNNYGALYMTDSIKGSHYAPGIWIESIFNANIIV